MAQSFTSLLKDVRSCTICSEHLPLGSRPVLQLHPKAKILVVGQAPGARVHETGIPFNDPSGDRLRVWMGVSRETFYDAEKLPYCRWVFVIPAPAKLVTYRHDQNAQHIGEKSFWRNYRMSNSRLSSVNTPRIGIWVHCKKTTSRRPFARGKIIGHRC